MELTEHPAPSSRVAPIAPWQRLLTGQNYFVEVNRLFDARFMLELEMLVGPNADPEHLRKGAVAATHAYIRERRKMRRRKQGVSEHRRLSPLSDKLEVVIAELARVHASPNCAGKLSDAMETLAPSADPISKLASGATGPGDPVGQIVTLLGFVHIREDHDGTGC